MKFTAVLALVAAATAVSAATNAQRFARGLPPNAPAKRGYPTPPRGAPPSTPSNTVNQCNTGSMHCCQSVQTSGQGNPCDELIDGLGAIVPIGSQVGVNCSPITAIGIGSGADCTQQPVCCDNNQFNGILNVGCSPINL